MRRFQRQTESLCAALATLTAPMAAANFVSRALHMLQAIGWIAAHRFLFADCDSTGWAGRRFSLPTGVVPRSVRWRHPPEAAHTALAWSRRRDGLMLLAQEDIRMDAKSEKIARFRFGAIASLVLVRPSSTPSNSVSSFVMRPRSRHACA